MKGKEQSSREGFRPKIRFLLDSALKTECKQATKLLDRLDSCMLACNQSINQNPDF